jgi:hypothetical protein
MWFVFREEEEEEEEECAEERFIILKRLPPQTQDRRKWKILFLLFSYFDRAPFFIRLQRNTRAIIV